MTFFGVDFYCNCISRTQQVKQHSLKGNLSIVLSRALINPCRVCHISWPICLNGYKFHLFCIAYSILVTKTISCQTDFWNTINSILPPNFDYCCSSKNQQYKMKAWSTFTYIHTHICMYTYIYIYICMHLDIYIYKTCLNIFIWQHSLQIFNLLLKKKILVMNF